MASSILSYLEKLSSLLMVAGRSSPRYQMLAAVYSRSKDLQSHLSEYFIIVVRICHHVLKFSQKSTIGQFAFGLSDTDIKAFESQLQSSASNIKEEMDPLLANAIET